MTPDGAGGANVFAAAVQWLEAALLGTVATAIAVIAIASIGFLMLSGRIDARRSIRVLLGCFILCGASVIAGGIVRAAEGGGGQAAVEPPPPPLLPARPAPAPVRAAPYDPYAGAALPTRP